MNSILRTTEEMRSLNEQVLKLLKTEGSTASGLAGQLKVSRESVSAALQRLKRTGDVVVQSGLWVMSDNAVDEVEPEPEDDDAEAVDDLMGSGDDEECDVEIRMGGTSFTITVGEKPVTITLRRVR